MEEPDGMEGEREKLKPIYEQIYAILDETDKKYDFGEYEADWQYMIYGAMAELAQNMYDCGFRR